MPDLGPHAVFIWGAYALTFFAVGILTASILIDDRQQRVTLAELERRGIKRASKARTRQEEMSDRARSPFWRRVGPALPLIAFASLAGLFWFALHGGDPSRLPSALVGREVPDFTLPPVDGLLDKGAPMPGFAAADLKTGAPTIVNVFASWCVPCHEEHPVLMELATQTGIRLYGINYKDDAASARRFLGRFGNPFARVGADTSGRVAIDWGVYGVPETYVIGGDGKIAYRHVGPLTEETIKEKLLPLLESPATADK